MKIFVINKQYYKDGLGGAELQCYLISKYLAKKGHEVFYIALKNEQASECREEGFTIIRMGRESRLPELLSRYKPDVCYIRAFDGLTWLIRQIGRHKNIQTVFHASSMEDADKFFIRFQTVTNPKKFIGVMLKNILHYYDFRSLYTVDTIIALSEQVARKLERHGLRCTVIKNSIEHVDAREPKFTRPTVIWVANVKWLKGPEYYVRLAAALKDMDVDFIMVGDMQDKRYGNVIAAAEKELPCFRYVGPLPQQETLALIQRSTLLVNTSLMEGFGNVFIEAWMLGLPTVSLYVDPDGVIEKYGLGFKSGIFAKFIRDVKRLLNDDVLRKDIFERAKRYYQEHHDPEKNLRKIEEVLHEVMAKGSN